MVAYTNPQKRKKEEGERLEGARKVGSKVGYLKILRFALTLLVFGCKQR